MNGPRHAADERRGTRDRGAATIWVASGIAALLVIMAVVLEISTATITRHRAGGAADLAALAAAEYALDGQPAACGQARWVAERMRVRLDTCRLAGWNALVEVTAQAPGPLARFGPITAHAMAGPVDGETDSGTDGGTDSGTDGGTEGGS